MNSISEDALRQQARRRAGMKLGAAWDSDPRIKAAFHSADAAIGGLILLAVIGYVVHRLRGLRRR